VLGACLAWAVDNKLTRKVAPNDATWIASVKRMVAGSVNLLQALWAGSMLPTAIIIASGLALGLAAYAISLVLFVIGLRHLATARTGAYFSAAPFFGAVLAVT
jgi:drug/metabolite transporter (DMT)-like permease